MKNSKWLKIRILGKQFICISRKDIHALLRVKPVNVNWTPYYQHKSRSKLSEMIFSLFKWPDLAGMSWTQIQLLILLLHCTLLIIRDENGAPAPHTRWSPVGMFFFPYKEDETTNAIILPLLSSCGPKKNHIVTLSGDYCSEEEALKFWSLWWLLTDFTDWQKEVGKKTQWPNFLLRVFNTSSSDVLWPPDYSSN